MIIAGLAAAGSVVALGASWLLNRRPSSSGAASATATEAAGASARPSTTVEGAPVRGDAQVSSARDEPDPIFDQRAKVASATIALAAGAVTVAPPLGLVSVAGLAWLAVPVFRDAYVALVHDRKVRMSVVDAVVLPAALGTGHLFAAAVGYGVIIIGRNLLSRTEQQARDELLTLFGGPTASVERATSDGAFETVPAAALSADDVIRLRTGQTVPVDGVVVDGHMRIDQRMLTGESQPIEAGPEGAVLAATVVVEGIALVRVKRSGAETVAAGVAAALARTVDFQSTVQSRGEALGDRAALPLLGLSALALPLVGSSSALAILFAPLLGTVRLAAPIGVLRHLGRASADGILIRDGRALEAMADVDTFVFDKTGTLTTDRLVLQRIVVADEGAEARVLALAASAEQGQSHPIARALLDAAAEQGLALHPIERSRLALGRGLDVGVDGHRVVLGSLEFVGGGPVPAALAAAGEEAAAVGASVVYATIDERVCGLFVLRSVLRPETRRVVDGLRQRGHAVMILSGDREAPTRHLAQRLDVDEYFAETLPKQKADVVRRLQADGRTVCFIGDGINDAIALKQAHVSVSMNDASRIASETAQVVLTHDRLGQLLDLVALAEAYSGTMRRTTLAAVVPSALCIGGALAGAVGLAGGIAVYTVSLGSGLINAIWPIRLPGEERERS